MYVALYRKYRPKFFKDVISQEHITTTLKNEIKLKKVAHSYVFTGPKGTGKTSCAKIFSKAINCKNPNDGEPCCECSICRGLEDGSILDVVEMDGASNNGVDDVRILKNEANFVPTRCSYKIYIIDEVHMLSSSAFNALLKIMEEPPQYVVFILATTNVNKIPPTILSRCQRFDFKRIKVDEMKDRILKISQKEEIEISEDAARKISIISQGSMRDAISIFDKCSVNLKKIETKNLDNILCLVDKSQILNLHNSIKKSDNLEIIKTVNTIYYGGKNLEDFVLDLVNFYREMIYFNIFKKKAENFLEYAEYLSFFETEICFEFNTINFILKELLNCFEKIKNFTNQKLLLELTLLKICEDIKNFEKTSVQVTNNLIENRKVEKIAYEKKDFEKAVEDGENILKNIKKKEKTVNNNLSNFEKFIEKARENNIEIEDQP